MSVNLVELANSIEKRGLYDDVSQDAVLRMLMKLHNLGRIRIDEHIRLLQQGKTKKNAAALVEVTLCSRPPRNPSRWFGVRTHLGVVSKSLTEAERAVIRDAVRIMRSGNAELATDLAAIVDEYARDLPAVD